MAESGLILCAFQWDIRKTGYLQPHPPSIHISTQKLSEIKQQLKKSTSHIYEITAY